MDTLSETPAVSVSELVSLYLSWVKSTKSENTHRFYAGRLKAFLTSPITEHGARAFGTLKRIDFERYFQETNYWPDGREKTPDTQRSNMVAIERLQWYAIEFDFLEKKILKKLDKPVGRIRERLPESGEVLDIKTRSSPEFCRIYQALRQSGARPGELSRATVADWDRAAGMIVLAKHKTAKKTGRPRKIMIGENLVPVLLEAIGDRTEGLIFLSPQGKAWNTNSLSATFRRARIKAKISGDLKLYATRHKWATEACKVLPAEDVAKLMGHSNTAMLMRYNHQSNEQLRTGQDAVRVD